jgi:hypothetical protein
VKKITFFLLFYTCAMAWGQAQPCNCNNQFDFLKNYVETNYAGFSDKLQLFTVAAYNKHTGAIKAKLPRAKKEAHCLYLLSKWLEFFKDGHIQLGYHGNVNTDDTATVKQLLAKAERILLKPAQLKSLSKKNNIEGIYWFRDSSYKIAVVHAPTSFRDYAAVVLQSKTNLWQPGMVKFELKQNGKNKFDCIFYYRDHHAALPDYVYNNGIFNNNEWIKEGATPSPQAQQQQDAPLVYSKTISDKTHYIRIGSFDASYGTDVDSLLRADSSTLNNTPNLILDLRGNGGGADFVYAPLLPYLYTNAINTIGADVLATKDNIEAWQPLLSNPDLPDATKQWVKKLLANMQANIGRFVSVADDETLILRSIKKYPEKIVILIDNGCASTTEQLLLAAMQSKKVTLMGQPSAGVLDYANMRNRPLPCLPYTLSYATTRSRRVPEQAIDNKGIAPAVVLNRDTDWIYAAQQYMEL